MNIKRALILAGGLAGAVVVGGSALYVNALAAPSPSPSPGSGGTAGAALCGAYDGHLASNLGVSASKLNQAAQSAIGQTLADLVKSGKLTQAEADQIKARMNGKTLCLAPAGLHRGGIRAPFGAAIADDVATALGITPAQLKSDLTNGQTVQQIATAKGISEVQFQTNLYNAVKTDLDARVKSNQITQAQEDRLLARIKSGNDPFWNLGRHGFRGPKASTPAPTATP